MGKDKPKTELRKILESLVITAIENHSPKRGVIETDFDRAESVILELVKGCIGDAPSKKFGDHAYGYSECREDTLRNLSELGK